MSYKRKTLILRMIRMECTDLRWQKEFKIVE